ncbi:hypothetical protein N7454_008044 [Penicillium verhagenii]|nr:hypothetical protein N7454_008044 [Penicillium verhagenii]
MVFIKELSKFSKKQGPLFIYDSIFTNDQYDYTFNGVLDYDQERDKKKVEDVEEDDEEDEENEDEDDPQDEKYDPDEDEVDSADGIE